MQRSKIPLVSLLLILLVISILLPAASCSKDNEIILASTTSTQDSGLFDVLIPAFEKATGYTVKVVAVGTGEALELGEKGEADVVLVHSRSAEDKFVEEGYGTDRRDVMYNDYLIVGPADDPAKISGMTSAEGAFKSISDSQSLFVSRGDDSGTNKKEITLWEKSSVTPEGDWYIETGQGMGETLRITDEKQGYTLTDRGTWLAQKDNFSLIELVQGDPLLFNPYGIIAVNPEKHPDLKINYEGAMALVNWITGEEGQKIIKEFGIDTFGQPLFYPDVIK